jgi:hypothetical protein
MVFSIWSVLLEFRDDVLVLMANLLMDNGQPSGCLYDTPDR